MKKLIILCCLCIFYQAAQSQVSIYAAIQPMATDVLLQSEDQQFLESLYNNLYSPLLSVTGAIGVNYELSKKVSLRAVGSYQKMGVHIPKKDIRYSEPISPLPPDLVKISAYSTNNYHNLLSLRLDAGYEYVSTKKVKLSAFLGVGSLVRLGGKHTVLYFYEDGTQEKESHDLETDNLRTFNVIGAVSLFNTLQISERTALFLEPQFSIMLLPHNIGDPLLARYYALSANVGVLWTL